MQKVHGHSRSDVVLTELQAYWNQRAPTYNVPDVFGRRVIQEYLRRIQPTSLVEIGCGHGELFPYYKQDHIGRVVGIDWSEKMLARSQARIERHGYSHIKLRQLDITKEHLDEQFDVALTRTVLMHIPPHKLMDACGNIAAMSSQLLLFEYWEQYPTKRLAWHNWLHNYEAAFTKLGYDLVDAYHRADVPQVLYYFKR